MARLVPRRESRNVPAPLEAMWDPFRMMREMMRWDPFRELEPGAKGATEETFVPRFDVKETADHYELQADLPGVREEDVDISMTDNRLTISGKRESEEREEGETYYAVERSFGSFSRSFTLPQGIDPDQVEADFKNGVLSIRVPKQTESRARKISLKGRQESAQQETKRDGEEAAQR